MIYSGYYSYFKHIGKILSSNVARGLLCYCTKHRMASRAASGDVRKVHKLLDELLSVFEIYKNVLRANSVDFYTDNRIDILRAANPELLTELLSLSPGDLLNVACGTFGKNNGDKTETGSPEELLEVQNLSDLTSSLRCERLAGDWFFPNAANYSQSLKSNPSEKDDVGVIVKPKEFMNMKKSHEVAEMSSLCSSLIKSNQLNQVIDIGSGKGYLSQYLTLQYGVRVTGIDSSDTNTHGAKERSRKLTKHWKAFMRRAAVEKNDTDIQRSTEDDNIRLVNAPSSAAEENEDQGHDSSRLSSPKASEKGEPVIPDGVSPGLASLASESMGNSIKDDAGTRNKYEDIESHPSQFQPVTAFVSTSTDLTNIATSGGENGSSKTEPFLLVGLHTCGDLASTLTRLFVDCPSARALCFVPCCYHFLSEEFEPLSTKFYIHPMELGYWGFPMSDYIRAKGTNVGRDAKMLACMAQERMAISGEMPVRALFYRAVLQVLLRDHYRIPTRQESVGKLAHKTSDFVDYTRKALKRLNFDVDKLSDETINQYHTDFSDKINLLHIFTAARLAFARMVESLLLLDKLCYLLEQPGIESASIVRLFDPVQSPRCYAIVATKDAPEEMTER